ncbi:hypothetical protein LTR66_007426 [Elasticomyces elasticus]|nr:hypothetical protein LTR66_007426 [Elasticomyces elasticus]
MVELSNSALPACYAWFYNYVTTTLTGMVCDSLPVTYHAELTYIGEVVNPTASTALVPTEATIASSIKSSIATTSSSTSSSTSSGALTPATTTSAASLSTSVNKSPTPIGAIVGGVLGGIALICLTVITIFCLRRRKAYTPVSTAPAMSEPDRAVQSGNDWERKDFNAQQRIYEIDTGTGGNGPAGYSEIGGTPIKRDNVTNVHEVP